MQEQNVKPAGTVVTHESELWLGWRVTPSGQPQYWLRPDATLGGQQRADLVVVPAHYMGAHTVVVAQSGSGKSFFLGRLLEELLIATRARCIVLDPNADFAKCNSVDPKFGVMLAMI
jgi:hypothetical protein